MKKKIVVILLIVVVSLSILKLYQTYAISSNISMKNDNYNVVLSNDTSVVVDAGTSKTVYYKIKNTNNGTVIYGIGYKSNNTTVKVYSDSENPSTGRIDKEDSKFIKLYIENNTSNSETVNLTSVLGYVNGGDLIAPDGYKLVNDVYIPVNSNTFASYITNLYNDDLNKETVLYNGITYNYAKTEFLMNDRKGSMSIEIDSGNIRYYGSSPNNYVYFNCDDYSNSSTCEKWKIIGVFDGKVKIMRGGDNGDIGSYSWDEHSNDWSTSRLMKLLNPSDYYPGGVYVEGDEGQSLYWNGESGMCFISVETTEECNFTNTGLKNDITRNLIAEVTYNLGGLFFKNFFTLYSNEIYEYEREETVYEEHSTTWIGKVAIPYLSDYTYAADLPSAKSDFSNPYFDVNWILSESTSNTGGRWLLNPLLEYSEYSFFMNAEEVGYISSSTVSGAAFVFPTLFLNSNINIKEGNGSSSNPYVLDV